ncbi:transcription factor EGL1-like [Rhodamnia argentea]|uniref:Transcription factor EGL1-like n=1 Tax=Rhodamnia argentea TaxID=178133 RepID=A0A8B8QZ79_9MYRT|nr:transcription factor EGL1-like [Rhodamnia argentea]
MASGMENQGKVPANLKKKLALAVRKIQWSYGIFWSISTRQPGVLEWGDGYYNGDIKTRKTIQAVELNTDQIGMQRSEQLRELYESLSAGESSPQVRRPSAALSPEDLTDTEWYYLVCMSFIYDIGQGLPGRTLTTGQPTWLCNAHYADSKVFSRSLLAKSASIQTVVCFPFLGGVIELGVTDLVLEDPGLIHHVKSTLLEIQYPTASKKFSALIGDTRNQDDVDILDHDILDAKLVPVVRELDMASPDTCSNDFEANQLPENSFVVEVINGVASQAQSWQFMDDEFSNCLHHSVNSSDCISQTIVEPTNLRSVQDDDKANDPQGCDYTKPTLLESENGDVHYQSVLSSLLKTSHQLIIGPHFQRGNKELSFVAWKKGRFPSRQTTQGGTPQRVLKRILFQVPRMYDNALESPLEDGRENGVWRPEADEIGLNHAVSERKRKEKINDRLCILKSMVPSVSKVDKLSILDDTIVYLRELQRRVEELESCGISMEVEAKSRRKPHDMVERTSDNCGTHVTGSGKKPFVNKRKASDIDSMELETNSVVQTDVPADNLTVKINDRIVLIEMRCSWREGVLLEIINEVNNLHLDSHSVQSSTIDGILYLTINSKFTGTAVMSAATIKHALQRFALKRGNSSPF